MSSEYKIIQELKQGKLDNFTQLYDQYVEKIYRFIYYRTSNEEVAQDLTSQTFLKAINFLKRRKFNHDNFSAWIYKIAKNLLIDYYRQKKETLDIEEVWFVQDQQDTVKDTDTKVKIEKIKQHLSKLNYQQREILIMRVWDELSYKEISEIMNKQESNCKVIFSRAVKNLKQHIPVSSLILLLINL